MKFMISCRQPLIFLKEAEEIRMNYKDIDRIKDFITEDWVCQADIVIYISKEDEVNWSDLETYKKVLNIVIATENTGQIPFIKNQGYKTFWSYPISSYWELQSVLQLGVDQVLLDAPLYFDLPKVKNICGDVEIRLIVNKCFNNNLPHENGICGTYVRPEDIEVYNKFVEHFEFDQSVSLKQEYTLYNIYVKDKQWLGNLNILLINLKTDVDNRGFEVLPNEEDDDKFFAHRRISCGQKCQGITQCSFCPQMFNLINAIQKKVEDDKEKIEK